MRIRDARLAILDTSVVNNLATSDATSQQVMADRLAALRKEGLLVAVTGTVLMEIAATGNPRRRETLIDTVESKIDGCLLFTAIELLKMELAEKDPAAAIGDWTLYPTTHLAEVLDRVKGPEAEASSVKQRRLDRVKLLASELDARIKKLTGLQSFGEYVRVAELDEVKKLLEIMNADGRLGHVDMSPEALKALLERGKATRMAVLMALAYTYRRAKKQVEKKEATKPGGALSDAPILEESAYTQVLLTADIEFFACGELVNEMVAEPVIRLWEPT